MTEPTTVTTLILEQTPAPAPTPHALTAQDIKALRQADSVCFFHFAKRPRVGDNPAVCRPSLPGVIAASKRVRDPGPFDEREKTHRIEGLTSRVTIHEDPRPWGDRNYQHCFAMIHGAQHSLEWQTVAGFLKAGDIVELVWVGADDNGYLRSAVTTDTKRDGEASDFGVHNVGCRLYHDKLYLTVRRRSGGKAAEKRYQFWVNDNISPDNSARMIRPE